jgi:hypothetical protein
MADAKLVRHLKVLADKAQTGPVPALKFFSIGNPAEVEGEGEVIPILSWVDDNLSRYVVSNSASSEWGRSQPPPLVVPSFFSRDAGRIAMNRILQARGPCTSCISALLFDFGRRPERGSMSTSWTRCRHVRFCLSRTIRDHIADIGSRPVE